MTINKKKTYEQHDNESINYYRYSIDKIIIPSNLENDLDVDICVVGGGLTGVLSALNLSNKGYNVVYS